MDKFLKRLGTVLEAIGNAMPAVVYICGIITLSRGVGEYSAPAGDIVLGVCLIVSSFLFGSSD